jgi:hypothetical protein
MHILLDYRRYQGPEDFERERGCDIRSFGQNHSANDYALSLATKF